MALFSVNRPLQHVGAFNFAMAVLPPLSEPLHFLLNTTEGFLHFLLGTTKRFLQFLSSTAEELLHYL